MKKIIFLFMLGITLQIQAQNVLTQTIKGTVVDKQSQSTLPGVSIVLVGSNPLLGTTTDLDGNFKLVGVPVGRNALQISYMGYETVSLGNLLVNSVKELDLKIELQESLKKLDEVVVRAQDDKRNAINTLGTVSIRTFSVEEAARYSGSLQDPSKMAQNFAGVSGANDSRNDIIIRGNSPIGVLWRMDGIDIPSPNHFASLGSTGGPVSMLNINNLSNSDFMTGAWSPNYGNALSGVFDLNLRNGNADKREYLGQIGFNGFELGAEGPFKKGSGASYLVNYRYSTLGLISLMGINLGTGAAIPQYQDLTFKMNIPTKNSGRFTIWGIGGISHIDFDADPSDSTNLYSGGNQNSKFGSTTGIVGASHTYFFNPKTYQKLAIAASTAISDGSIDSISSEDNSIWHITAFNRRQNKYSINYKLNHKFNASHNITAGVFGDVYQIDILDSVRTDSLSFRTISDMNEAALLVQSYINWQWRPIDNFSMNLGVHSQHFLLSKSNVIEPRIGMKYTISANHSLTFGAGLHSQIQPITIYFVEKRDSLGKVSTPNKNLDFSKSLQTVLGYEWFVTQQLRVKAEAYYQYLFNIPVENTSSSFSMINQGADFAFPTNTNLVNKGTGYNYGLELTVEKFYSRGFYFLLTASLFESKYKGSDGMERNTAFNGNYVLNALGGKEFKLGKKTALSFDTKVTYAGGKRFTPIDLTLSQTYKTEIRDEKNAYSEQYKDYFRFDFKITFRYNGKKTSQMFAVDLQNLSGSKNVFAQGFNPATGRIGTVYQRGFFPDVQYKIYF